MGNVAILWKHVSDIGALTDGGVAGWVESGGLSLQNLRLQDIKKPARFLNIASHAARMQVDMGSLQAVSSVVLVAHNASAAATLTLTLSNTPDFSAPVATATGPMWLPTAVPGTLPWGVWPWSGVDRAAYPTTYTAYLLLSQTYFARYLRVEVTDPANPDGYFQAGRLLAGVAYQPPRNYSYGLHVKPVDPSQTYETPGGAFGAASRPMRREFGLPFDYQSREFAWGVHHDMCMRLGIRRELFIILNPDEDAPYLARQMFYCRMTDMSEVTNTHHNLWGFSPTFAELI
ncbi:hypothetical protein [Nitrospirillum iridis]|uniref:Uncharacterized protein n=1 Tax=Nitrospirillum iridis TaxID=765888 RepID=A0A7X0EEH2_9PROT|nr:hypothetical protein [Nitrospirillum iridis]MBB6251444.1 hypothetical protein [Nitrospirillum iridis]